MCDRISYFIISTQLEATRLDSFDAGFFVFTIMTTTSATVTVMPPQQRRMFIPAVVMLGAFLFSSKGIFIKLLYAEGLGPSGALALRMSIALPFYLIPVLLMGKELFSIRSKDWSAMAGLAFVGYFLSSLINFTGLQYISIGLERVILFSYPTLVLLGATFFQNRQPSGRLFLASGCSWFGLYLVIREEIQLSDDTSWILLGSGMVLLSAMIYAGYILLAKPVIERIGASRYTSISMCFSCLYIMLHFAITDSNVAALARSPNILIYGAVVGILGTVAPTYILSYGLSKIPSTSYAVISSVGPVATIALSLVMLQQTPGILQLTGIVISLIGSVMAGRCK